MIGKNGDAACKVAGCEARADFQRVLCFLITSLVLDFHYSILET